MQPATPDTSSAICVLNDTLKVLLPVLALATTALGIKGTKWDEEKKRPTAVGYAALITGVLVAVVSVASWWTENQVKRLDSKASELRQAAAVEEERQHFQKMLSEIQSDGKILRTTNTGLERTNKALANANAAQQTALDIALRQLPIDEIELRFRRGEIEAALPKNLMTETLSFQKPLGELMPDDKRAVAEIKSQERVSLMGGFQTGQLAVESFHSVFNAICRIVITPASFEDGNIPYRLRMGSEDSLTLLTLDRRYLRYRFAPDKVSVSYFYASPARLELPLTHACLIPPELRLRIRSFG